MDLAYYVPNGEWDLLKTPAHRISSGFAGSEYIIPSALISMSNILGFMLPPECGEKITLQITNLLSVTVFLGIVAEVTPPTSESVPAIAAFFSVSMIILGVSIFFTLIIINVFFRSPKTHKMSSTTRKVFLEWLPWMLLMNRPGIKYRKLDELFSAEEDVVLPKPSFKKPELRRNDVSVERMIRRDESDNSLENSKVYKRDLLIHEAAHGGIAIIQALKKSIPSSSNHCKCECHGDEDNQSSASSNSADTDHLLIYDTLKELNSYIRLRRRVRLL
uniref:Neurotransmitter-gated ion-channel transmembrane domain-containing protein n=1 Tax=Panagrolaimus superbus TaxID=310955 RepID=A0A914YGF0_9BILA